MKMASTVSFGDCNFNYGSEIGNNYGSVTNELHLPWGILTLGRVLTFENANYF